MIDFIKVFDYYYFLDLSIRNLYVEYRFFIFYNLIELFVV